jgi:hypothetical protein
MVTSVVVYKKQGATFASSTEARADLVASWGDLADAINQANDSMVTAGVLLNSSVDAIWDQATQTLQTRRVIRDIESFDAGRTYDKQSVAQRAAEAGWEFVSQDYV